VILALCLALLLPACAARTTGTPGQAPTSASQEKLSQELKAILDAHPELVLEVLDKNKVALFDIVEKGIKAKQEAARAEQTREALNHRLDPALDPARPALGPADAPITIVEYSDFLCPYCARAAGTMRELLAKHPGQIRLIFKHLALHDGSEDAARSFEAAGMQGADKAWKLHDLAFARMQALGADPEGALAAMAKEIGLDQARLAKDLKDKALDERLAADEAEAKRFKLSGTPMFLVNGVLVQGAQPLPVFEDLIGKLTAKP
jgi:protein-disulfide isomerase